MVDDLAILLLLQPRGKCLFSDQTIDHVLEDGVEVAY